MKQKPHIIPGRIHPLGSTWDGKGVNFALFSAHAEKVELCLFSEDGKRELWRLPLPDLTNQIWNGYIEGLRPGTVYGYRVYGSYQPDLGHRFNHHKLLLDPYTKQLRGQFIWHPSHFAYDFDSDDEDLSFNPSDNAAFLPKAVVTAPPHELIIPQQNRVPKRDTVLYEAHVKGLTMLHPGIPQQQRGTFLGMGHRALVRHLQELGITSLELLPVQGFLHEQFLVDKQLSNYWGYNTLTFFAPHQAYLHGEDVNEFRTMVDALHDAGIEVILDVVYNHTAEGGRLGPTVCFRGIDNLSYYRLQAENRRYYINDSGCGNTLDLSNPFVLMMVMDSLRYWVTTMGVDGFRFDLATVLGREHHGFDKGSGFFDAMHQDPTLAAVKFIAEPWDIGPGGYQVGNFPAGWSEWNDRYRDTVRRFWRGDAGMLPEFARRLHGSSDIFEHSGRRPSASINFVTSHDGFTLHDLVSYNGKHNEANLEDNRDGHSNNYSFNFGVEGPTDDPDISELRRRQQRNFLTTLVLSQGTPMLCAGDELGRTQHGNNNAYCHDSEMNWLSWNKLGNEQRDMLGFTRYLLSLKKNHPSIWCDRYLHDSGKPEEPAIRWFNAAGEQMQPVHWGQHHARTLVYVVSPVGIGGDHHYLVLFNAANETVDFKMPLLQEVGCWQTLLDTSLPDGKPLPETPLCSLEVSMVPYSCIVMLGHNSPVPNMLDVQLVA